MKYKFIDGWFTCLVAVVVLLSTSCNSTKKLAQLVYLQDSTTADKLVVQKMEPVIQPGDRITITVSAFNPASAAPFNMGGGITGMEATSGTSTVASAAPATAGYLVKPSGYIQFPQLGNILVGGKTLQALTLDLTEQLTKYVTDPLVTINFVNYKVTMLGEVNRPGPIPVPDGKLTIMEAIGQAGDLTLFGRRDNILVVREQNGQRTFGRVNLLTKNIYNSPFYQLQQNDVVYVELTRAKAVTSDQQTARNISLASSVIAVISTLIIVIVNVTR